MKKFSKIIGLVFVVALVLTGCATVSNIKNDKTEVVFNGNAAVLVSDHLYFGNGFSSDSFTATNLSDENYGTNAANSYLARVNLADVAKMSADEKNYSPKEVENVTGEVTAYENSFMFALGDLIYYIAPNVHQVQAEDGSVAQHFDYVTLYCSRLDGNKKQAVLTTTGVVKNIEVLKYQQKYYIVMLAGSELYKIDLSNNKSETISTTVSSVAIPKTYQENLNGSTLDWNGKIYFTATEDRESLVKYVNIDGGESVSVSYSGTNLTFVGRERDVVFFTATKDKSTATFKLDTNTQNFNAAFASIFFFQKQGLSDIKLVTAQNGTKEGSPVGYMFVYNNALMFAPNGGTVKTINLQGTTDFKVLFVDGSLLYFSTTKGIYAIDLLLASNQDTQPKAIVEMEDGTVHSGNKYAFDGKNVYFYAKLQTLEEVEDEDQSSDEDIQTETDDNFYLYKSSISSGSDVWQLLGRTQISSRHVEEKE